MNPIFAFSVLQLLDVSTTVVALKLGATEQNPIIGKFLEVGPLHGLIMSKLVVILLAAIFLWLGKTRAIRLANFAFAGVVLWNLAIIGLVCLS